MPVVSSLHDPGRAARIEALDDLADDVLHVKTLFHALFVVTSAGRVLLKCDVCHDDFTDRIEDRGETVIVPSEVVCACGCVWPIAMDESAALVRQLDEVGRDPWAYETASVKPLPTEPPPAPEPPTVLFTWPGLE